MELAEDGNVTVGLGGQELGQGTFTVMAQMAAAALGVPYEKVRIAGPVDTQYSPYEWQTVQLVRQYPPGQYNVIV